MYWQVYLHKTSVAAEKMLVNILKRAKELASKGTDLFATPALHYFLYNKVSLADFEDTGNAFENFVMLDDSDFFSAIKVWSNHPDLVLSLLCKSFINRRLFKVEIRTEATDGRIQEEALKSYMDHFQISLEEARYFMGDEIVSTDTYQPKDDNINILMKDGSIKDIADASDMLNIQVLTKKVMKHYFCYLKI
jgi:HD superfamily phosphohydrolase